MKVGFVDIEVNSSVGIPYITQLVTLLYDTDTKEETKTNLYIKLPEGIEISKEMQDKNGITHELLDKEGVSLTVALDHFRSLVKSCNLMCGYYIKIIRRYLLSSAVRADDFKSFNSMTWQLLDTSAWWNGYYVNLQACILDEIGVPFVKNGREGKTAVQLNEAVKQLYGEVVKDDAISLIPYQKRMFLDLVSKVENTSWNEIRHSNKFAYLRDHFYYKYEGCLRQIERDKKHRLI